MPTRRSEARPRPLPTAAVSVSWAGPLRSGALARSCSREVPLELGGGRGVGNAAPARLAVAADRLMFDNRPEPGGRDEAHLLGELPSPPDIRNGEPRRPPKLVSHPMHRAGRWRSADGESPSIPSTGPARERTSRDDLFHEPEAQPKTVIA